MAKLLIQDGALRYRPGMGLALDDCPECCDPAPSQCCASGAALTAAGFTTTGPNIVQVEVAINVTRNGQNFTYSGTIAAANTTFNGGQCLLFVGNGPSQIIGGNTVTPSVSMLVFPQNSGCGADILPRTNLNVRVSGLGGGGTVQMTGFSGPGGSWWRANIGGTGNFCTSTSQGVSSYSPSGSSGTSNWSGSGSVSGTGGWATGVMGTHMVNTGSITYNSSWSAQVITPMQVCPGVLALDGGCSTCNDNNTGGFTV